MPVNQELSEFMGLLLPKQLDNCLRLQALLQGTSRSAMTRKILQETMENNDWDEQNLVARYSQHLYSQWYLRYREATPFPEYLEQTKSKLVLKHKLPKSIIEAIIRECEEEQKRQSPNK